jgi:hypothetical protein
MPAPSEDQGYVLSLLITNSIICIPLEEEWLKAVTNLDIPT